MIILAYLLAGLITLIRVCVPVSMTALGSWPIRLALFLLWFLAVANVGGNNLRQFFRTLKARWLEMICYVLWIAILTFFWLMQNGEHGRTAFMLTNYIGTIPFYFLGTYYSVKGSTGLRMAVAIGIVVVASCLLAISVVWWNPEAVRIVHSGNIAELRAQGVGNYGELTGFAVTLPFFIAIALQSKNIVRVLGIASCVATFALSMISTLSGVIFLAGVAVAGCILYYLLFGGFRWQRFVLAIAATLMLGLAAIYVFPSVYEQAAFGKVFDKLTNTFTNLPDILSGQATDPTERYTRLLRSLQVFWDNPVIGVGLAMGPDEGGVGGHSSWGDALAWYGLLGATPYLLFHLLISRLWQAWRSDRSNTIYWGCLYSCALFIFYGIFNITSEGTLIALFLYVTAACGQRSKEPANRRGVVSARPAVNR